MTNGLRWHVPWLPFVIISAWDACESVLWVCAMENACFPVVRYCSPNSNPSATIYKYCISAIEYSEYLVIQYNYSTT